MSGIIPYASRTGTKRNLDALRSSGWRLLVSATGVHRTEGFPYAIDNGAWTAHQQGKPFDELAFLKVVEKLGAGADWIAIPDIVAGGLRSLEFSVSWLERLSGACKRLLLPVQDGMQTHDVAKFIDPKVGIFVGGSTDWKLATMHAWCRQALAVDAWCHVGRVNSARRIRLCQDFRATSFDGTSATRFCQDASQAERNRTAAESLVTWVPCDRCDA